MWTIRNYKAALTCFLLSGLALPVVAASPLTPVEARAIAKDAYIYGYPLVENYRTLYKQAVAPGPDFKAPFNQIGSDMHVATPQDRQFVTPNSDTPYSYLWMDLRAEPLVLTLPKIEKNRYYTAQLVDLQTHNFAYLGTRLHGNGGGDFLITGPRWRGKKPAGIRAVVRSDSEFAYALIRTQLFNADDLGRAKEIQRGYRVRTLTNYLGTPAVAPAEVVQWPPPSPDMSKTSVLFRYLNFLLKFCRSYPDENALMARFARLDIGPGLTFDADAFTPEIQQAIAEGIADAWHTEVPALLELSRIGKISSGDFFGTRQFLGGNYAYRFFGAKVGIYGNSREEAIYFGYKIDAKGRLFDAAKQRYVLRFEKGELPPSDAFWSLTMYDGATQLLVENPIKRYLINSPMLDTLKLGDDGSLSIYIQKNSPGTDRETNWLPAPDGPFYGVLRIYLPKPEVLDQRWPPPTLVPAE